MFRDAKLSIPACAAAAFTIRQMVFASVLRDVETFEQWKRTQQPTSSLAIV